MAKAKTPSARESLLSKVRERYPDRKFAEIGETPSEGVADLDEAINEMLTDLSTKQAEYDANNGKLSKLLMNDPSAAEFLQKWIESGDPRTALIETFGDDLGMNEESRSQFKDQLASWQQRKAENEALEAEAEENWQTSLNALEEWGNAKGLSLEEKRDVMLRLLAITFNGMVNKYEPEDFDLAFKAIHHDADVEQAREEGEVNGRNQKIGAARRERNAAGAMPPAPTGRQGGSMAEPKPEKKSFWGEVNKG